MEKSYQSVRIAIAKLFEHVHNFVTRFDRLKIFWLQVVFLDTLNSEAKIRSAWDCFTPNLRRFSVQSSEFKVKISFNLPCSEALWLP